MTLKGVTSHIEAELDELKYGFKYKSFDLGQNIFNPWNPIEQPWLDETDVEAELVPLDYVSDKGNRLFKAQIANLEPGKTYYYRAYTYDGMNYNYGDPCSFTIKKPTDDSSFIYDYELNGTKYALYRQLNKDDVRYNADRTPYYRTTLTLDVTKNGTKTTYTLDDGLYTDGGDGMTPSMAIDLKTNKMYIFINSSNGGYSYSLNGYCYISSLDNFNFQKEMVFTNANWGWWPYFTYDNGTLRLKHFSFAYYYAITSTRNSNGSWSNNWGNYIYPDNFKAQWETIGSVLVIR